MDGAIPNDVGTDREAEIAAVTAAAGGHAVMFWLLVLMAAAVFAPCVLIPIYLETKDLMQAQHDAAIAVVTLNAQIAEQHRLIDALNGDPLVNERLARRDLRYRRVGEELQPLDVSMVPPAGVVADAVASWPVLEPEQLPPPPAPPELARMAKRWLPDLPWVELFGKPPNRTIFLLMAGSLLVAAFVLFGHAESQSAKAQNRKTGKAENEEGRARL